MHLEEQKDGPSQSHHDHDGST